MTDHESIVEQLVVGLREAVPEALDTGLRQVASTLFLDFAACSLEGARLADLRGCAEPGAILAALAHAHDRDDLHWPSLTHPGTAVWGTALEVGGTRSFRELAVAALLGYELTCRLALALGQTHRARWHVTTTAGAAGAAVTAGYLLDLQPDKLASAVTHALSVAGGSTQALAERSGTRLFHRLHVVRVGLAAAHAAKAGLIGQRHELDAKDRGYLARFTQDGGSLEPVSPPFSLRALAETSLRMHDTSGFCQTTVELGLQSTAPWQSITAVTLHVFAGAVANAGAEPHSDESMWWSLPGALAGAICTRDRRQIHDAWHRGDVQELARRVRLVGDQPDQGAIAEFALADGTRTELRATTHLGMPGQAPTPDQLAERWQRLAGADWPGVTLLPELDELSATELRQLLHLSV